MAEADPGCGNEADRLLRLDQYRVVGTAAEPEFDRLAALASELFGTSLAVISFVDRETIWFKAVVGIDACEAPREIGFCSHTIRSDDTLVVPEMLADARFRDNPLVLGGPRIRFYAGAPLVSRSGHRLGSLCVMDTEPRSGLSPAENELLRSLARLVVDRLELRRAEFLNATARGFLDGSADPILCIDKTGCITFINPAAEALFGYASHEMIGQSLDLVVPERFRGAHAAGVRHVAGGAPSKLAGKTVEISALRRNGEEFPIELGLCVWRNGGEVSMGATVRDISERKKRDLRLHRLAHHDPLTGLANRSQLDARLAESFASGQAVALLLIDLNGFKQLNDTLGHTAGDTVLQALAVRLPSVLDHDALVARIGGDEFAVLLPGIGDPLRVSACANGILDALAAPFKLSGHAVLVEAGIGAAIGPHHGEDGEELFASADLALCRAKQEVGHGFRLFEFTMRSAAAARRALQDELLRAVERKELVLHYQPQVNLRTGTVFGAEALLRWQHPERGLLQPGTFLPVLESHSLALEVGTWVLDEACRQAGAWRSAGLPPVRMSVNLFAAQIRAGNLVSAVSDALSRYALPPDALELEITETIALQNESWVSAPMRALRDRGVGVALDDFGTGYASLSTLKGLPLTTLKIDRGFVRDVIDDPQDAAIVEAMLCLGSRLDLGVIAEGVEHRDQERFLAAMGCASGQGYLYGRSMPADAFAGLLAASTPVRKRTRRTARAR